MANCQIGAPIGIYDLAKVCSSVLLLSGQLLSRFLKSLWSDCDIRNYI